MSQAAPLLLWSKAELKGTFPWPLTAGLPVNRRRLPKTPQRQGWVSEELSWQSTEEDQGGSGRPLFKQVWGAGVRSLSQGLEERESGKKGLKGILLHKRHGKPGQGCSMLPALPKAPDRQPSTDFYMMKNKGAKSK